MPVAPQPLGDAWRRPFRVGSARRAGIREGRLRRQDLEHRFHGSRAPIGFSPVQEYSALLRPGERFSHTTAAALYGAPLPARFDGQLHVTVTAGATRSRAAGVIGHRGGGQSIVRSGLPVSMPIELILELATMLTLDELVAVIDFLVLRPRFPTAADARPFAEVESVRRELQSRTGRGIRRARDAAALARPGCESPKETELRLLALRAGLPEPECNVELHDADGRIGWFDLVWRRWRIASEYDGDQHRVSTGQYERDITRFDRASAIGYTILRVRKAGLREPSATVARLRAAFRAAGWRPGDL